MTAEERFQTEKVINELVSKYEGVLRASLGGVIGVGGITILESVARDARSAIETVQTKSESDKLRRILYLSMKNLSSALAAQEQPAKALNYALRAYALDESNSFLLYHIGKLSLDMQDTWTCMNTALRPAKRAGEGIMPAMAKRLRVVLESSEFRESVRVTRDVPQSLCLLRGMGRIAQEFLPSSTSQLADGISLRDRDTSGSAVMIGAAAPRTEDLSVTAESASDKVKPDQSVSSTPPARGESDDGAVALEALSRQGPSASTTAPSTAGKTALVLPVQVSAASSRSRRDVLARGSRQLIKDKYEDDVELTSAEMLHNLFVALQTV